MSRYRLDIGRSRSASRARRACSISRLGSARIQPAGERRRRSGSGSQLAWTLRWRSSISASLPRSIPYLGARPTAGRCHCSRGSPDDVRNAGHAARGATGDDGRAALDTARSLRGDRSAPDHHPTMAQRRSAGARRDRRMASCAGRAPSCQSSAGRRTQDVMTTNAPRQRRQGPRFPSPARVPLNEAHHATRQ